MNLDSLKRNALALIFADVLKRHDVMEPISKLDDEDSEIVCHCHKKFSQTFDMALSSSIFEFSKLRHSVYKVYDFITEDFSKLIFSCFGIFKHIMEKSGFDCLRIHSIFR